MSSTTIPSWAASKTRKMNGSWGSWPDMNKKNIERLQAAESKGRLDFVLYGDSITSYHFGYTISSRNPGSNTIWNKHFGSLNAVPLAIPGDQIGQVVWRLTKGHEKPKQDPKVIGLLIGINDCLRFGEDKTKPRSPPTAERMEYLIKLLKTLCPTSAFLLCGLTPVANLQLLNDRKALNASYKALAEKYAATGMRIKFVDCSASFTKSDGTTKATGYLSDTLHLTAKAHEIVLRAMRSAVDDLRSGASSSTTSSNTSTTPPPDTAEKTISKKTMAIIGGALIMVCCCCCFLLLAASRA